MNNNARTNGPEGAGESGVDGISRRAFLRTAAAGAGAATAAAGMPKVANARVAGPTPARIDALKSDNPHGGQLVAHALKREGVSRLFTLCGGHILPILDGCLDEGIKVLDGRHEEAVAHMGEAWSWITGEVGVISVTAGPGVTNAVTGVANAYENGVPMLVLGGRSSLGDNEIGSLQDIDQMDLYESITKWSRVCHRTERIGEYVAMAFRHALSGRPGPVYLELPQDVLMARVKKSKARFPEKYRATDRPRGSRRCIAEAAKIFSKAERPVIVAGAGCRWSHAQAAQTVQLVGGRPTVYVRTPSGPAPRVVEVGMDKQPPRARQERLAKGRARAAGPAARWDRRRPRRPRPAAARAQAHNDPARRSRTP